MVYITLRTEKKSVILEGFHDIGQIFNIQYDHPSKDLRQIKIKYLSI